MTDALRRGATTAQLKADIDAGRTGDKVTGFDPAASPLGTDDEAGGAPPSPQVVAQAREAEGGRRLDPRDKDRVASPSTSMAPEGDDHRQAPVWRGLGLGGGAALLLAGAYFLLTHHG